MSNEQNLPQDLNQAPEQSSIQVLDLSDSLITEELEPEIYALIEEITEGVLV